MSISILPLLASHLVKATTNLPILADENFLFNWKRWLPMLKN
ncbi:hypothetical protein SAMN03097694_1541 [Janthinobacterium lividum]|uniref:Uncharacterized protein n=1 Tax=Janthinobacterium lividum TaxID=29581 RepID=A0AB38C551_9BURK|nr:hypothetical protein SAMN03097694_1541 [Janthinobacterium lividum]